MFDIKMSFLVYLHSFKINMKKAPGFFSVAATYICKGL